MTGILQFGKVIFKFFTSVSDLTSDVINSLDFLGHNATSTIAEVFKAPSDNATSIGMPYRIDQTWGALSMFFIFLPGVALGISTAIEGVARRNIQNVFFGLLIIPFFPLALVGMHLWTFSRLIKEVSRRNNYRSRSRKT